MAERSPPAARAAARSPRAVFLAPARRQVDWRRASLLLLGVALFFTVYFWPPWADAVDPAGKRFVLGEQGQAAIGLLVLAIVWWGFEVIPVGVTSIALAVLQALLLIRPDKAGGGEAPPLEGAKLAFQEFLHPSVWFIFGSLIIGRAVTKTGLAQRLAYRVLTLVGERTSLILLGFFAMTALLTHFMAHTAVVAALFPLFVAIYHLYDEGERPTRFGKALFVGMAFSAGAGSVITLLGSARGAVGIAFFKEVTGQEVAFLELSLYLAPLGWMMVLATWGLLWLFLRPEHKTIPGLRERAQSLYARLGPMSRTELLALSIVLLVMILLCLPSFFPTLAALEKSGIILIATVLFFITRILDLKDLEEIPWNIVLLFGGAVSLGVCLVETGAANWMAVHLVGWVQDAPAEIFLPGVALVVLAATNLLVSVVTLSVCLPVGLKMAPYLGLSPEVVLFVELAAAGMPFLFLVGSAPNAIAFESRQFTPAEFFRLGLGATILLLALLALFTMVIWPGMGMSLTRP
jgi:sodium-dependent dicarboxylate transporter 2/3/5